MGHWWIFGGYGFSGFFNDLWEYSIPTSSLPVRFSNFTAQQQQQTVLLNWTTAQEQNSRYFIVERASDGLHYDSIGLIAATGNTSMLSNYHFVDKTPYPVINYYRLRQPDQDGKSFYSSVIKVSDAKADVLFAVVQNPVQNTLQLSLELPADQQFTLQIRDMNGQLVMKEERLGSKGSGVYSVPVDRLKRGAYVVQLSMKGMNGSKTFIKQ